MILGLVILWVLVALAHFTTTLSWRAEDALDAAIFTVVASTMTAAAAVVALFQILERL